MFTGIVTDLGKILTYTGEEEKSLRVATHFDTSSVDLGASIACCGICLTVVDKGVLSNNAEGETYTHWFDAYLSPETLACTTAHAWHEGMFLNLEKALCVGQELGGHMVTGHVDGVGRVTSVKSDGEAHHVTIEAPETIMPYVAEKGSITVDGISLTVNAVTMKDFRLTLIPHTWEGTNCQFFEVDTQVNLEIDVIARYIARMTHWNKTAG